MAWQSHDEKLAVVVARARPARQGLRHVDVAVDLEMDCPHATSLGNQRCHRCTTQTLEFTSLRVALGCACWAV